MGGKSIDLCHYATLKHEGGTILKRVLRFFLAALLVVGVLSVFFISSMPGFRRMVIGSDGFPLEKRLASFQLNSDGGPITPSFFQGRPSFVYFGYIQCGTRCPSARSLLRRVQKGLQTGEANFLFVQLEAIPDGPPSTRLLAPYSDDSIRTAFSDDESEVRKMADNFGVSSDFNSDDSSDHSDILYFVDSDGVVRRAYPAMTTTAEEILNDYKIYKKWRRSL